MAPTRLTISGPQNDNIVGILEQKCPNPAPETKIIIMMHGHAGNKNYCYQRHLAELAPFDSFRFDFRGNGESGRSIHEIRTLKDDMDDIDHVLGYLREEYSYRVWALVGHSRGANAAFHYVVMRDQSIPLIVNCSGRFTSELLRTRIEKFYPGGLQRGSYIEIWKYPGGVIKERRTPAEEVLSMSRVNNKLVAQLPPFVSVLTIFGSADHIVPITDATRWTNILQGRHTLRLIPNADHNFFIREAPGRPGENKNPQVAQVIATWLGSEGERKRFTRKAEVIGHVERWKNVDGVSNFRDLGGWQNKDAEYIKTDRIYRCADLSNITDVGKLALKQLQVKKVFDLRSVPEIQKNGVGQLDGAAWVHVPVFRKQDYSPEKMAVRFRYYTSGVEGFVMAYTNILQNGGEPFGTILRHLRDSDDPIVIHCTAGKDRTGVICAIILKLLGCEDDVVAREYELTTVGLKQDYSKIVAAVFHEGSKRREAYNGDGTYKEGILSMLSSKYDAMIQTLDVIRSEYGDVENYVKDVCDLSDADIQKIRTRLLIKGSRDGTGWIWGHVSRL